MPKGMFEKSADTSVLENRLRSTKPGEVIEYAELSKLLGRDVRMYCNSNLATARKTLVGESIFFDVITGEGFKRLTFDEAVQASGTYVTRAKSAAHRGMNHLAHVPFDDLSDESKKKHLATSAQLGVIKLFGSSKSLKKIEEKVNGSKSQLAIGETLKLFGG